MPATYPATEHPQASLLTMERGGFMRWEKDYVVVWFFKLPDADRIFEVADYAVPTIDGKPRITLNNWTLDKGEDGRMVWVRGN